jgi:predicted Zn-dependent protease
MSRSDFEVAKTIFGLEAAGLVSVLERSAARAARSEHGDLDALVERAHEALEAGDVATAQEAADQARVAFPHEPAALLLSGAVALRAGQAGDAEEYLRRALRQDPALTPGHRMLGDALALQGRHAEAVEWWQRWIKVGEQGDEDPAELDRVREAVQAAETLQAFLARSHG